MKTNIETKINDLLTREVGEFVDPDGAFKKKLIKKAKGEYKSPIVIKFGIDPTRPDIHLGHAVILRKLRQFQDLGCKIIFLVGDFTAMIGDPTGKSKIRPEIDNKEMIANINSYISQIPKILKIEPEKGDKLNLVIRDPNNFVVDSPWFGWMRNAEWFQGVTDVTTEGASSAALTIENQKGEKFSAELDSFVGKATLYENTRMQKVLLKRNQIRGFSLINTLSVLRHISHSQLIERSMFQERLKSGEPLFMHEMLYPVFQGIDSDVISDIYGSCDLEVGGTDQTFNMIMGRKVMEMTKKKEIQAVLAFKLLEGLDGKEKMSKSLDNYIGITDEPNNMYGKIMSIPDSSIANYFKLCTDSTLKEIEAILNQIRAGENPRDIKMRLAREIVTLYHGADAAQKAEEAFVSTFQKGAVPDDVDEIVRAEGETYADALVRAGVVASKSDLARLLDAGAVSDATSGEKCEALPEAPGATLKIGKRRFVKLG